MALQLIHRFGFASCLAVFVLGIGLASSCASSSESDPDETGGEGGEGGSDENGTGGKSASNKGKAGNGGKAGAGGKGTSGNKNSGGSKAGNSGSGGSKNEAGKNAGGGGKTEGGGGKNAGGGGKTEGGSGTTEGGGGKAGEGTAGGGTAGSDTPAGTGPAGYWSSKEWHGCSWTGVGEKGASTIDPKDFTKKAAGEAYCAKGSVGKDADYSGVALVGFNISESNPQSCVSTPVDKTKDGPPAVTTMPGKGIAANIVKQGDSVDFVFRIQIQGPKGHMDGDAGAADRWCAAITETQGKVFIPYTEFWTECWGETEAKKGKKYNGEPIDAVVFTVPGKDTVDVPYNFCVNGFAYGDSAADAPDGTAVAVAEKGTIGGQGKERAYDRVKVTADGEQYIVQNNNWGAESSSLVLSYNANSFKITTASGGGNTGGAPASFPSIFIGANGNIQGGQFSTSKTDELPRQISGIKSIKSTFQYSGSASGVYNAAYDIWFASSKPEPGSYDDAISGFVMIWLREPSGAQAIGSNKGSVQIAGKSWNKWVGPRGGSGPNSGAPVVSYVNPTENDDSRAKNFTDVDILEFIKNASGDGIQSSWYLTDVFTGFEIWSGGQGLSHDKFTCVVTPN